MKKAIRKLILGKYEHTREPQVRTSDRRQQNLRSIWENEHHDDFGIEKVFRLFLAGIQFAFPLSHIKHLAEKHGGAHFKDLVVDAMVLTKIAFPLIVLVNGWQHHPVVYWLIVWFVLETTLYIPALIFASDAMSRPRSYRRSMLLVFLNYLETIAAFAVFYAAGPHLSPAPADWFDSLYFSVTTASALGMGDFVPVTATGKVLVICQQVLFLLFVIIFLNYFSANMERRGYFQ
ncbi:MAG: two pore domain potassium channel family protein [Saprospiraceae bacterium]|nr:two pore domain potassium channel family protein [Saprospiraceae bacterium]MBP9210779.1 two pore domain potassium channel family protein [Saprospiraceae bacterium]